MSELMSIGAKNQVKKEIIEAWTFLRRMNNTVPDETLDFMRDAALEKLNLVSIPEENLIVINNEKCNKADVHYGDCTHWQNSATGCWNCEKSFTKSNLNTD